MRYVTIDTISFTDDRGISYAIKAIRPIEELNTLTRIKINNAAQLDEIATRPEIYGEGFEFLAYKIFDHNVIALAENDFDLSKMKEIKIPNI